MIVGEVLRGGCVEVAALPHDPDISMSVGKHPGPIDTMAREHGGNNSTN
jgi:hypothetical protein